MSPLRSTWHGRVSFNSLRNFVSRPPLKRRTVGSPAQSCSIRGEKEKTPPLFEVEVARSVGGKLCLHLRQPCPFWPYHKKLQKFTIVNILIFDTLNTTKTKLLFTDSSFYIKVLFIFSSQAQCKISLKFLLILHLVDK